MDIGAIFFTLAVVALVGMYVGQPFIQRRGQQATKKDHEYSALMAEYERAINTLQELDFDNALGKIPADDFPGQRAELLARGASLLRKLDAMKTLKSSRNAESRLEAAVASGRADSSTTRSSNELSDDDLESMIAARRKTRKEKSAGFCPNCGKSNMVSDRYCPSCGKAIP